MHRPDSPLAPVIRKQLDFCIGETDLTEIGERYGGKVRDTYKTADGRYVLVTTDRISAFDFILPRLIPFKGQVLNQISQYFFEQTADIVPNHILSVPDPNVTVARHCRVIPIEFVVRGYLAGHAWRVYQSGERRLCGHTLPAGLKQNSRFDEPLLTPATKASAGHDEDTSAKDIIDRGLMSAGRFAEIEAIALALFDRGTRMAAARGLILVDTKYEFGTDGDGTLVLIDEVHTPDSSRYFYADTYQDLLEQDRPQRQLSKEFVREWLMSNGFQGLKGQHMPDLPDDFRVEVASRYIELFEVLTGRPFEPHADEKPLARIRASVRRALDA